MTIKELRERLAAYPEDAPVCVNFDISDHDTRWQIRDVGDVHAVDVEEPPVVVIISAG